MSQTLNILHVQVGGGFVQGDDATVHAERLRKGQADDDGSQNLKSNQCKALLRNIQPISILTNTTSSTQ